MAKNYFDSKKILITGASGFVGGWLVQDLLAKNASVTCIMRDLVPNSMLVSDKSCAGANIARASLENFSEIERTINEYESEIVIHLGAQAIVGTANRSPMGTFSSNVMGTVNVLEACRLHDKMVKSVVIASSDKAYGEHKTLPYSEDAPLQGSHPYDVSKSCTDLISQSYGKTYGMPISISRCGNFFGGGDLNFSRIVPGTIKSALENTPPVIRSDGKFVRDYIYVKDAVSAYEALAEQTPAKGFKGEAFNFSNEQKLSVLEMTGKILKAMGKERLKPVIKNEASNEIREQHLSSKKAREMLGWQSAWGIDKGLGETIKWYEDYFAKNKK